MSCKTCPFAFTDESEIVQNYGCLPTPHDIISIYKKHQAIWGCHCTSTEDKNLKECTGFINYIKKCKNTGIQFTGNEEIIDYNKWYHADEYYERFKL